MKRAVGLAIAFLVLLPVFALIGLLVLMTLFPPFSWAFDVWDRDR